MEAAVKEKEKEEVVGSPGQPENPTKKLNTTETVAVMMGQLQDMAQVIANLGSTVNVFVNTQGGVNAQLISTIAKIETDRADQFSNSKKADALEAGRLADMRVEARTEADRQRRAAGAGQKVAQSKMAEDSFMQGGNTAPLGAMHDLLDPDEDPREASDSWERRNDGWAVNNNLSGMDAFEESEDDGVDISRIEGAGEFSQSNPQKRRPLTNVEAAKRQQRKIVPSRTPHLQFTKGLMAIYQRRLRALKLESEQILKRDQSMSQAVGSTSFGDLAKSPAMRVSLIAAETTRQLQYASTTNGEQGVVRVETEPGPEHGFRRRYGLNYYTGSLFCGQCVAWDCLPGHIPSRPGMWQSEVSLELMVQRLTALKNETQVRIDLGIGEVEVPTVEQIKKMLVKEWYKTFSLCCVPLNSRELESSYRDCVRTQELKMGWKPGEVPTELDKNRLEYLIVERCKLFKELQEVMPQYSQERTPEGKLKNCLTWPGSKPDKDMNTSGVWDLFFSGVLRLPRSPDGTPDLNKQTIKKALFMDVKQAFVPTVEDKSLDSACFLYLIGMMCACWEIYNKQRKSIAPYEDSYSSKGSNHGSVPMMHEAFVHNRDQPGRIEVATPVQGRHPGQAQGGTAKRAPQLLVPYKPDATQQRLERELSDLKAEAAGERPTPNFSPGPYKRQRNDSPFRKSTSQQHTLQAMTHRVEEDFQRREQELERREMERDEYDFDNGIGKYAEPESDEEYYYDTANSPDHVPESWQDDSRYRGDRHEPPRDYYYSRPHYEDPRHDVMASLSQMNIQDLPPNVVHAVDLWQRERNAHDGPPLAQQRNSAQSNAGRIYDPGGVKRVAFSDRTSTTKSAMACNELVIRGTCKWADRCTFSHDPKVIRDAVAKVNQHQQLRDGGEGEKSSSVATISHALPRSELSNVPVRRTNSHSADDEE